MTIRAIEFKDNAQVIAETENCIQQNLTTL